MFARLNHSRLLRYAGLFTWAVIGMPLLLLSLLPADQASALGEEAVSTVHIGWQAWAAYLTFGISYGWLTRALGTRRVGAFDYLLLLLLTGSAVAISYYSGSGLGSILLMVAACVLPWLLPLPLGIAWLILSEFLVVPVYVRWLDMSWLEALMQSLLYAGFSGFVFVTSLVARQQAQAREEQRRLNSELRATRALLAESARVNERTRISRELHDLLGHHLTALSLNLEVAGHLVAGQGAGARQPGAYAGQAAAQRRARGGQPTCATTTPSTWRRRCCRLADNVPGLEIAMEMPSPFLLDDPERAHVLLRCTQEIITNAVRHAHAQTPAAVLSPRRRHRAAAGARRRPRRGSVAAGRQWPARHARTAGRVWRARSTSSPRPVSGFALDIRLPLEEGVALLAPAPAPTGTFAIGPAEAAAALK